MSLSPPASEPVRGLGSLSVAVLSHQLFHRALSWASLSSTVRNKRTGGDYALQQHGHQCGRPARIHTPRMPVIQVIGTMWVTRSAFTQVMVPVSTSATWNSVGTLGFLAPPSTQITSAIRQSLPSSTITVMPGWTCRHDGIRLGRCNTARVANRRTPLAGTAVLLQEGGSRQRKLP